MNATQRQSGSGGNALAETMRMHLNYEELTNCMRCGFCQPACPTFQETGIEAASPRGRIALMKAVTDGLMVPDDKFQAQMNLCLGCRACEPVCPSDVKYGQLIEQTRAAIEEHAEHRVWVKGVRRVVLKGLFPHQSRVRVLGGLLAAYQKSGLRWTARKLKLLNILPKHMRQMESILPDATSRGVAKQLGTYVPAVGEPIGRVGMFRGCLMDILFTETNVNTVKLLTEAGFDVVIPENQNCCGALMAHAGELEQARELAANNVRAFKEAGVDYIVTNAGGCGASLIEYDHLLHENAELAVDAEWFSERLKEVTQLILEKGRVPSFKALPQDGGAAGEPLRISYQDSCHQRNVMRCSSAPRDMMRRIGDVEYVEMNNAGGCCGSAGIYNLVQPDMSMDVLDHKMENVKKTNAQYVLTSNPGCLLQMKHGIEKHGAKERMEAKHIVDYLYERIAERENR